MRLDIDAQPPQISRTVMSAQASVFSPQPAVCKFYQSSTGCKRGSGCTFLHPAEGELKTPTPSRARVDSKKDYQRQHSQRADQSRVVPKPVPKSIQQNDPNSVQEHHLVRLKRRYPKIEEKKAGGNITLQFQLIPSDPALPFDISHLDIILTVPSNYPISSSVIHIKNADIPRGYAFNIERAWNEINGDFLTKTKELDRRLEEFLSMGKVETVKIVKPKQIKSEVLSKVEIQRRSQSEFTAEQIAIAKVHLDQEISQLQARLRDLKVIRSVNDSTTYEVLIRPLKTTGLPEELQRTVPIHLFIPSLYPLQLPDLKIPSSTSTYARNVEREFIPLVNEHKEKSLFSILNILQIRFCDLAMTERSYQALPFLDNLKSIEISKHEDFKYDPNQIYAIPPIHGESDETINDKRSEPNFEDTTEAENAIDMSLIDQEVLSVKKIVPAVERGISISFPNIHLSNISLLETYSLSLMINCARCKAVMEVPRILRSLPSKILQCQTCSSNISVAFRPVILHQHERKIGYLDLAGASPQQLLPSSFQSTCTECGTQTAPYTISPAQILTQICRKCHARMDIKIDSIKFLKIGVYIDNPNTGGKKIIKQNIGIKIESMVSVRRFPCCLKVYACSKCHDALSDHPFEFATRQICGYCSKEQIYSQNKACVNCGTHPIKKTTPFWEGGDGLRDKVRMSRKDKRKFKKG
ncbi:hypothetical protein NEOLI_003381 [Neolecta irregularis DAH-3]|uniref:CHY-type domain-containing protein n=1 Tax=Neolecta irregularis (strain DAH-3) TaxID=1198029 RepID=A0A1U7LUC8_NEOID|nr:hypothetical protein NEOLI_003381 [Neolecta irregularis DAH-3]|eukprot:OLL26218.1 hypothetical protein NEOLI_003381 [Neolecta irregularis DAH-3]